MTLGIIIVFHNNEKQLIDGNFLRESFKYENITLCLVNNASTDNTLNLLTDIKEEFQSHLEILDIKKYKSIANAIRAGERFLSNGQNRKHIGYINLKDIDSAKELDSLLKAFNNKKIRNKNINLLSKTPVKQQLIKNIFSAIDCISNRNLVYPNTTK